MIDLVFSAFKENFRKAELKWRKQEYKKLKLFKEYSGELIPINKTHPNPNYNPKGYSTKLIK